MKNTLLIITLCALTTIAFSQSIDFHIMSFNIQQPYGTDWEARQENAVKIIQNENADIIGTQEAINTQRDYILDHCPEYAYFGLGRDGNDSGEGAWIMYKKDKYTIDSTNSGNFWLSETPDKPSRFDGDYNRICSYVRLIDTATQRAFYVYNAHFPTPDLPTARLQSMKLMAEFMANRTHQEDPILATGDFNSSENTAPTKWMKAGEDNPIQCRDTYRDYDPNGNVTTGFGTKFDYIYCENNDNYITDSSWVIKEPVASDHYPIAAKIRVFFSKNGNQLPIANAGNDILIIDSTASMSEFELWLDAGKSYDPDGLITSYSWSYNDEVISEQGSSTITFGLGNYPIYLTVTDNLGVTTSDQMLVKLEWFEEDEEETSVDDINTNPLVLYPSPVIDLLEVSLNEESISTIIIYTINGTKVKESIDSKSIDMSMLKSGLYIIEIQSNGKSYSKKVMKQ